MLKRSRLRIFLTGLTSLEPPDESEVHKSPEPRGYQEDREYTVPREGGEDLDKAPRREPEKIAVPFITLKCAILRVRCSDGTVSWTKFGAERLDPDQRRPAST